MKIMQDEFTSLPIHLTIEVAVGAILATAGNLDHLPTLIASEAVSHCRCLFPVWGSQVNQQPSGNDSH